MEMNDQTKFQNNLLIAIVTITCGMLILIGRGASIDTGVLTTIGGVLMGLIGALGGHAIGSSQSTKTGDILNKEIPS